MKSEFKMLKFFKTAANQETQDDYHQLNIFTPVPSKLCNNYGKESDHLEVSQ